MSSAAGSGNRAAAATAAASALSGRNPADSSGAGASGADAAQQRQQLAPYSSAARAARRSVRPAAVPSDDPETTSSGEYSDDTADDGTIKKYDVYGSLKGLMIWDTTSRRLCLGVRQYAETGRKVEFKARGVLDSVSGDHRLWGHVRRNFYTHVPLLQRLLLAQTQRQGGGRVDEPSLDPDAFLPGGLSCLLLKDWAIAPGVGYDTAHGAAASSSRPSGSSGGGAGGAAAAAVAASPQRLRYQLAVRKNPQVIKTSAKLDVWAYAKALAEFEPRSSEVSLAAGLRLKMLKYGLTPSQDVKVTLGLDFGTDASGGLKRTPYIHVGDNKVGARLQYGRWQVLYSL